MNQLIGPAAGVFATLSWSFSILLFHKLLAERGALACNLYKVCLASVLFALSSAALVFLGDIPLPNWEESYLLLASGVVGMAIGDFGFFQAIDKLGPRQAALIHATNPVFLLLFHVFGSATPLSTLEFYGVLLVMLGVIDVTRNQKPQANHNKKDWTRGLLWGLLASFCQAAGILIAKEATGANHPIHTGFIRLMGAALGMSLGLAAIGRGSFVVRTIFDKQVFRMGWLPVFLGTYLGILTMMVAIDESKPAVAAAVLSLTPVFLVPMTAWQERVPIPIRILLGTIVALCGVVLISQ